MRGDTVMPPQRARTVLRAASAVEEARLQSVAFRIRKVRQGMQMSHPAVVKELDNAQLTKDDLLDSIRAQDVILANGMSDAESI